MRVPHSTGSSKLSTASTGSVLVRHRACQCSLQTGNEGGRTRNKRTRQRMHFIPVKMHRPETGQRTPKGGTLSACEPVETCEPWAKARIEGKEGPRGPSQETVSDRRRVFRKEQNREHEHTTRKETHEHNAGDNEDKFGEQPLPILP